jgi:2,3-bisphosphoglycerate-dependent phosphoglycerate mutase
MKKDHVSLQRRPFLTPIWLAAIAAAVVVCFASWLWSTADSTTLILIRHAEKEFASVADPPLSAAGEARAAQLARMLGDGRAPGHIDAIYLTGTLRGRLTAEPLAMRLGLTPVVVTDADSTVLVRRALREHGGGRVLLISEGDTLPALVTALSGLKSIPPVGAEEYGTMYVVTVPRIGHPNLLRLNY